MKTLRRYMKEHGLNQTEMAKRLDVDRHVMSKWLNGKQLPSNKSLQTIAHVTGADIYRTLQEWGAIKGKRNGA